MKRFNTKWLIVIWAFLLFTAVSLPHYNQVDGLRVSFLDVGQGDAILLESKDGGKLLIDAGRGNSAIQPLSRVIDERFIDVGIVSHFDSDHMEGFLKLMRQYRFGRVFYPQQNKQNELIDEFFSVAALTGTELLPLNSLNDFRFGCCTDIEVLWPSESSSGLESNDWSIALSINYGDFSMYTGGDLSWNYEEQSILELESPDVDVLKVSHHGSTTSSSQKFIDSTRPEVSVISVGIGNSYGHPHPTTLEKLSETDIYRTDESGTVVVSVSESSYEVCGSDFQCEIYPL